ncbi:type 1 glutamine amidotransferase family protein [Rhizobium sp. BK251]|uniref:type 1 glutamine amidotransferase family protein n=1 Tax=Rhizobium sp. BK251 TaxID=2512125 RepID=UPI0010468A03|nr:type 1 glutamine amidotransferase family protein [Rhizobium sp. BK251]TCL76072.1 putative intracellular protease/amidase [Rhizobium sp. BK251]
MTRLAVVLTEGFADWEVSQLTASARTHFGFGLVIATPGGTAVTSMGGMTVAANASVEALQPADFDGLILCGGTIWETDDAPDLRALVEGFIAADKLVAAICGATLALARAGTLNNVAHTSNAPDFLNNAAGYTGRAHYRDVPQAVSEGKIVTAPGSAPITFTAEVYRALGFGGEELDQYVALFGAEHLSRAA